MNTGSRSPPNNPCSGASAPVFLRSLRLRLFANRPPLSLTLGGVQPGPIRVNPGQSESIQVNRPSKKSTATPSLHHSTTPFSCAPIVSNRAIFHVPSAATTSFSALQSVRITHGRQDSPAAVLRERSNVRGMFVMGMETRNRSQNHGGTEPWGLPSGCFSL